VAAIELANPRNFRLLDSARVGLQRLADYFSLAASLRLRHLPESQERMEIEIDRKLDHAL
jgi:hypothetical protein